MLKLVTWEGDLTQFLVDAKNNVDAIEKALKANVKVWEVYGDYDTNEAAVDTYDPLAYEVENVDIRLLSEIFNRNDCGGLYEEAIVFWD